MKRTKKIALFAATATVCLFSGVAVACGGNGGGGGNGGSSEDVNDTNYVYSINVQNAGGYDFQGVTVTLYDGNKKVASKTTNVAGNAIFRESDIEQVGTYDIEISGIPNGYALDGDNYKTVALAKTETVVTIAPQGLLESTSANVSYKLGDVVHDFTITTSDDETLTLSTLLEEKEMVLLNFWYSTCGPCATEFPAMNNSYLTSTSLGKKIEIIAISTMDNNDTVKAYKSSRGLSFPMADVSLGLHYDYQVTAAPTTVIIDRYGVAAYWHVGAITDDDDFIALYDRFIGDDYVPTIIANSTDIGNDTNDDGGEDLLVEPTINPPSQSAVVSAMGGSTEFTYRWQPLDESKRDKYSWPFKAVKENGEEYMETTIQNYHGNYATMYVDFKADTGDVLAFDYLVSTEEEADILYVLIDGVPIHQISGYKTEWLTCYAYVFTEDDYKEEHELVLLYQKDGDTSSGDDSVKVRNLRILSESELDTPDVDANIFRYAATVLNTDENATTQYKNYADVVLNETDGYYHVGDENGPLLFANMWYASLWNQNSVWGLAYSNYCVYEGFNFGVNADTESESMGILEEYAWASTHNPVNYGYVPVTEDLRQWLDIMMQTVEFGQIWNGEYHENEWLEVCVYYQHYGQTAQMEDPMKNITFHAATPLSVGTNEISVPFAMTPRGFKYKFTPEESGAYYVKTVGMSDPAIFLMAEDRMTFLGIWDDMVYADVLRDENGEVVTGPYGVVYDGNIEFTYYFEAGKTYYFLCTTYLDQVATYDLVIEYKGAKGQYLTNAATGPNSSNLITNEEFVPDAIDFAYSDPDQGGDGYYHELRADGTLGGVIYLDCLRTTGLFNTASIQDYVTEAEENYNDPTTRGFYVNGVDYTPVLKKFCAQSTRNEGELYGLVPVTKEVYDTLQIVIGKFDSVHNAWLKLCYYYVIYGE